MVEELMDKQVSSSSSAFARNLVHRAVDQLRYPCCFNDFVENLQGQENKLVDTWNIVDNGVKHSKTQVINVPVVRAWLEREAKPLKGNVEELLKEAATRTNKSCCFVRFPNWIWRYRMAKKLAKKKVEVQKCIKEGDLFIKLENAISSPDMQNLSSENSLKFNSRKDAFDELMEALKDDKVTIIGLYGMGGCGKTMMVEELKRTVEAEHLFNEVPFVTVSNINKVEVRSIQERIAKALQFPFPGDGESKRAEELRTKLTSDYKRTLLILDDVWKVLDFDGIGIPSGKNHKNFKLLITTRSEAVCASMKCQVKICLSTLTDEEAWALFQKQAHIFEDTFDSLKRLGKQISDECKGLPVAIAALAGTLKGKAEGDWQDALNRLRNSILVNINEADLKNPYKCLRVSYDNLDSEEAKSLLLLCSLFPKDFEIYVEYLTIFAIGLGLVGEVRSFEEARDKVNAAKNKLISSCLLSLSDEDDEAECVKMHDLVRDVALSIASEENNAVKYVLEKDVTLGCSSIRYLWCKEFPNELDCSSIEFLCLQTNLEVSNEIFKGMGRLRVLFLYNEGHQSGSLSTVSFKSLTNLRCLILKGWELGDISFVGYMKKLNILILDHCSFLELPDVVVTQLKNLRLLYFEECSMKMCPFEVIGRHPRLEELYFYDEEFEWDFVDEDHEEFFKMFNVPQTLRRYQIKLGSIFDYEYLVEPEFLKGRRALVLDCFDTSNAALKELATKAEVLFVANIKGRGKNIIPNIFDIEGGKVMIYGWIELWLCDSDDIEYLIDTSNLSQEVGSPFSKLCKLRVENMKHFGALYHGVLPNGLFEKLEKLYIDKCPVLTCLFTPSTARSLVGLEKLKIVSCNGLKHILAEDDLEDEEISRQDHRLVFSKLKKLHISRCEMLEYIIPVPFADGLEQLESLHIAYCFQLKYVFGQRTRGGQIQNELKIELPALKSLQLVHNSKMISIFPRYCFATWPSLWMFDLMNCPEFDITSFNTFKASSWKVSRLQDVSTIEKHFIISEYMTISSCRIESIFSLDEPDKIGQPVNLRSQNLNLLDLDQMKSICVGSKNSFTFQNLRRLQIIRCNRLEVIFPTSVLMSLPELQQLEIRECQEIKQIIEDDDVENQKLSNLVCSQPCFPKLFALVVRQCNNLKCLFNVSASTDLPNLELLTIEGASKLEELISCEQGQADEIGKMKVELPTLKLLVLVHLSNICQGIELPTPTTCVGHDCPKLSLTSSVATLEEFDQKLELYEDRVSCSFLNVTRDIARKAIESHQVFTPGVIGVENLEGSVIQKPHGEAQTIEIPQTKSRLSQTETYTHKESEDHPTNIKEFHNDDPISLVQCVDVPSSEDKIRESFQEGSISKETMKATTSVDTEDNNGLGVVVATPTETGATQCQKMQNVDDSIQVLASGLMDKEGEIGVASNGSIEVHQDTSSSPSLIIAELGAFKRSADLDDAQIALLVEAITVYPHLWKVIDKFSMRFQAFMLKILADVLFFLRNESAANVTPQQENKFQELCNEAVQLGFDKSWVDEMRQRVIVRDPGVGQAQARLNELQKRHDQLTQELGNIKDEIDNLHCFVDSQKKCFDFL